MHHRFLAQSGMSEWIFTPFTLATLAERCFQQTEK